MSRPHKTEDAARPSVSKCEYRRLVVLDPYGLEESSRPHCEVDQDLPKLFTSVGPYWSVSDVLRLHWRWFDPVVDHLQPGPARKSIEE